MFLHSRVLGFAAGLVTLGVSPSSVMGIQVNAICIQHVSFFHEEPQQLQIVSNLLVSVYTYLCLVCPSGRFVHYYPACPIALPLKQFTIGGGAAGEGQERLYTRLFSHRHHTFL